VLRTIPPGTDRPVIGKSTRCAAGTAPSRAPAVPGNALLLIMGIVLFLLLASSSLSAAESPSEFLPAPTENHASTAETITMARATWDTGWFQTEIFIRLLQELGYAVGYPKTIDNLAFYRAAARGEVDLWVNGWFPSHNIFLKDQDVRGKVTPVGFEVIDGALQGYLVDKRTAERFGITGLSDLQQPDLAALFDRDGNGKADLIGCNVGWGCEQVIEHHLDVYGLRATVEHVQGDYSPLMDETGAHYRDGRPVLFYTWTPNWTVGELVPGRDVVWLQVPFPSLPIDQQELEAQTFVKGVPGCAADPCAMGFPPNDIRGVANTGFLDRHPDVRRLLESVVIPLEDISAQNARMIGGEDTYDDIRNHALEWIDENRATVDGWLAAARALQSDAQQKAAAADQPVDKLKSAALRVVTLRSEPFVIYRDGRYDGFTIELWERIAQSLGVEYTIYGVNTIAKLLDDIWRGAADVAVAGIGITSRRESALDFSHAYFESGLQIMVLEGSGSLLREVLTKIHSVVFSSEALYAVGIFFIVLLVAAHVIWMLESRDNPQFPRSYLQGLWESVWWAVVTVTTVGYGDKTPKRAVGRLFGIIWILAGYFVFAYFTASVTTTATVRELHGTINGPEDLYGKTVATVEKSTAAVYLAEQGLRTERVENVDLAYRLLEEGKVEAVVYDAPVLQHYAATKGKGIVRVVGLMFEEKNYGMAFRFNSVYRDQVNVALLRLIEEGVYQQLKEKWFGSRAPAL
jgi:ABC-type proline/glycine betaine transport system substrate-binding protein/ABC-type amino acid transport substrate-binding protein